MFHLIKKYLVMMTLLLCGVDSAFSVDIDNSVDFSIFPSSETQLKAVHTIDHAFQSQTDLSGLTILDVGSFDGCNAGEMRGRGAAVYGLDINQNALDWAVKHGFIGSDKTIFGKIDDNFEIRVRADMEKHPNVPWNYEEWEKSFNEMRQIPEIGEEYHGMFDVITIFRIAFSEGEGAQKLANLLKPKGQLIIGYATHPEFFKHHKGSREKLSELFDVVNVFETVDVTYDENFMSCNTFLKKGIERSDNEAYVTFVKKD